MIIIGPSQPFHPLYCTPKDVEEEIQRLADGGDARWDTVYKPPSKRALQKSLIVPFQFNDRDRTFLTATHDKPGAKFEVTADADFDHHTPDAHRYGLQLHSELNYLRKYLRKQGQRTLYPVSKPSPHHFI